MAETDLSVRPTRATIVAMLAVLSLVLLGACETATRDRITFASAGAGEPGEVAAYLAVPEGEGPFPAVILMHGCTGLELEASGIPFAGLQDHARFLNANGYVTLIVDSHGSRGIKLPDALQDSCNSAKGYAARLDDATDAAAYLRRLSFVDTGKIALMGQSQGGQVVLQAMAAGEKFRQESLFAAGVTFYPPCSSGGHVGRFYSPVLVLIGELDDWTLASACEAMLANAEREAQAGSGWPVPELEVYAGTHHSFDLPIAESRVVNELGRTLAPNPEATARARQRYLAFLNDAVAKPAQPSGRADDTIIDRDQESISFIPEITPEQAYALAQAHCARFDKRHWVVQSPSEAGLYRFLCS